MFSLMLLFFLNHNILYNNVCITYNASSLALKSHSVITVSFAFKGFFMSIDLSLNGDLLLGPGINFLFLGGNTVLFSTGSTYDIGVTAKAPISRSGSLFDVGVCTCVICSSLSLSEMTISRFVLVVVL